MRLRYYIWGEDGPRRLPQAFFTKGRALPQYAGTRQKSVSVVYEWRGHKLYTRQRTGDYVSFDKKGCWDQDASLMGGAALLNLWYAKGHGPPSSNNVLNLRIVRETKVKADEYRWQLSDDDIRRIAVDLLPADDPRHVAIPLCSGAALRRRLRS